MTGSKTTFWGRRIGYNEEKRKRERAQKMKRGVGGTFRWFKRRGWILCVALLVAGGAAWNYRFYLQRFNPMELRHLQYIDIEGNRIFTAEENGEIIGYLFGHRFKSENMRSIMPEGSDCFEVEELYVIPSRRSTGIGRKLFEVASDAVRSEAEYMVLSTATRNWQAIFHFYLDELGMEFWSARLFKRIGTHADDGTC